MPEPNQITFTHKEVVTALLKSQGIHSGVWGLHIRFGLRASNVGASDGDLQPTAMIPVVAIGLQKFENVTNLSVDAAEANPKSGVVKRAAKKK